MVAIIDYDAGNIRSVEKAITYLGKEAIITRDTDVILSADHVILPGVGSFGDAMNKLESYHLIPVIKEVIAKNTPFMGICLGLHLLFEESDESPVVKGLGILPGRIKRIPNSGGLKIPHIGWNSLIFPNKGRIFHGIPENTHFYFVHSYYLEALNSDIVTATTEYGVLIHAAIEKNNIFACQFHPEKSSHMGLKILDNFLKVKREDI